MPAEGERRTACLRVADLPLAAELRAHPELAGRPLGVAGAAGPRAELVSLSPEAAVRGLRGGSTVAHARALCPELRVRVASPALERATREALLDVAFAFSPRAALLPRRSGIFAGEAAVLLDASGIGALFPSEEGFAAALGARAHGLGLPAQVAVASSRCVALIAARQLAAADGAVHVVAPGGETAFLAPLPVDILDPDDRLAQALTRFGVGTVRELLALPRRALGTRLGPGALELLAQVRGGASDPPLPVPSDARLVEAIDLDHAVDRLEPLLFVLQGLLARLLARLEARHLACGDLVLVLELESRARDARRVGVAAPTRDLRSLVRLANHALEARAPEAPVAGVHLETIGRAVRNDQLDLFRPAGPAPAVLGETLAELESLCGPRRVGAPAVADDHHPDAFRMEPFGPGPPGDGDARADLTSPLALRVLRPPLTAEVRLRQGRPESIRSAVANGRVVCAAGPWRTTGGWWSHEGRFAFDSFDVQTSDGTVSRLRFDHVRRIWQIDALYD